MTDKKYKKLLIKKDREISRLKSENAKLRSSISDTEATAKYPDVAQRVLSSRGYFGYLLLTAKSITKNGAFKSIAAALKKYTAFSRAIRTAASVISFLRASAAAVVIFSVSAILFPAAAMIFAVFFAATLVSFGKTDREMKRFCGNVFVFASKETVVVSDTAKTLGERGAVIYLTPSFSKCSFSGARRRSDGSFYVHVGYFFRMKRLLENGGVKIYFIV